MKENRLRNNLNKVYLSDEEYKIMKEKMKDTGNSIISFFIRRLIVLSEVIIYDLKKLGISSQEISRIGNNINQIARKLNQDNESININDRKNI